MRREHRDRGSRKACRTIAPAALFAAREFHPARTPHLVLIFLSALAILLVLAGCGGDGSGSPDGDRGTPSQVSGRENAPAFLPADRFEETWDRKGSHRVFDSGSLYSYINGGAEVFFELGFERLDLQRYAGGGETVGVEVYTMTDPAAARGIYLMKCGRETPDPAFGERHTVNRYHLLFTKGSAYVQIANMTETAAGAEALVPFARFVADRLSDDDAPGLFALLPEENRIAGTERVIRGPFTLQRVYALGSGDILKLTRESTGADPVTAVAADYEDESGDLTRIVTDYADGKSAAAALASLRTNLDPYLEVLPGDDSGLVFRDDTGRTGRATRTESRLEITITGEEE